MICERFLESELRISDREIIFGVIFLGSILKLCVLWGYISLVGVGYVYLLCV